MDGSSPYSDPNPFGSNYQWANLAEPSHITSHSDEEVMLASDQPKRRAGRKKFNETRHPVYRGVRQRNSNRWVCELREPNKKTRLWLGTFPTAEMAARAHDVAALALKGPQACLNFADSVWRLPVPSTTNPNDIRKAAVEAAEAFRPREEPATDSGGVCNGNEVAMGDYMDEEELFDMPGLIVNMAEGMLLSPPSCLGGDDYYCNDVEDGADVSLWSY